MSLVWLEAALPLGIIGGMLYITGNSQYYMHKAYYGHVGTVSMEWLAGEKTKVVGTFAPRKHGWTGYVEKDTAGQTNVYSIETVRKLQKEMYVKVLGEVGIEDFEVLKVVWQGEFGKVYRDIRYEGHES